MNLEIRSATPMDILLWLFRRRRRFRINGTSMQPVLKQGDQILIDPRTYQHRPPVIGDIVVARHPYQKDVQLVKRVTRVLSDERYQIEGDNASASTDSRNFGSISRENLLGRVTCHFF